MRRLAPRKKLAAKLLKALAQETKHILAHANPKEEAARRYKNARKTMWFAPVVTKLKKLSGPGQRCMFCSGSEASDVEHYRPKAVYPSLAMTWENYIWSCAPCNRSKLDKFPPDTEPGGQFVNPLDEDPWEFFFIDEFGFLTPRYDKKTNTLNERAVTTRDLLGLNREGVQESRQSRVKDLKAQAKDTLSRLKKGEISVVQARAKANAWRKQPFQSDVADYFLDGPGRAEKPFKELLKAL